MDLAFFRASGSARRLLSVLALAACGCGRGSESTTLVAQEVSEAVTVVEFPTPSGGQTYQIVKGPDGNLWFTIRNGSKKIGRITPTGTVTEYALAISSCAVGGITVGPDNNLWFTDDCNKIGRITTGGTITEFTIPTGSSSPIEIVAGNDGALWFTEGFGGKIGRVTTTGTFKEFPPLGPNRVPQGITAGADGNIWFTAGGQNRIGRITPTGVITEFVVPTASSWPTDITAGPDGNLWYLSSKRVGRITPAGVITEFTPPHAPGELLATGGDGNLWFSSDGLLARMTTAGVTTEFPLPTGDMLSGIAWGPDGNVWFTPFLGKVGRATIVPAPAAPKNLTVYVASASQVNLSWTDVATDEDSYRLERTLDGEHWKTIATLAANTKTFSDTGLNAKPTYTYRVSASKKGLASDFSELRSVQLVAPAAPSNLTGDIAGTTMVNLAWKRNATYGSTYQVESKPSGGSTFAALGGAVADLSTFSATGSSSYTTSSFRVYAQNGLGKSVASATITPTKCSSALSCDDGNPCTTDVCDATVGCKHTTLADGTACSDADLCTQSDICQAGVCRGTPLFCGFKDNCGPSCNPGAGACDYRPPTTNCINPVSVKVVDASGVAQANVAVSAYDRDTFMSSPAVANPTVTDASGVASIALPRGNYRFLAQVGGHSYWSDSIGSCRVPECITATIRLVPVVYVSVKYSDGAVAAGVWVDAVVGTTVVTSVPAVANAEGIATVTVPAGSYRFSVRPDVKRFYSGTTDHCTVPTCTSVSMEINRPVTVLAVGPTGRSTTDIHVTAYHAGAAVGTDRVTSADSVGGAVAAKLSLPSGSYRFMAQVGTRQFWSSSSEDCVVPGCTTATIPLPSDCANGVCPQDLIQPCSRFPGLCNTVADQFYAGTHVFASSNTGRIYHGVLAPANDGTWKQPLAAYPGLTPWSAGTCTAEVRDLAVHEMGNDQVLLAVVATTPCHGTSGCQCDPSDVPRVGIWEVTTRNGVPDQSQELTAKFNNLKFKDVDLAAWGSAGSAVFCAISEDDHIWFAKREANPAFGWSKPVDVEAAVHGSYGINPRSVSCQGQADGILRPSVAVAAGGRVVNTFIYTTDIFTPGACDTSSCGSPNMNGGAGWDDLTLRLGLGNSSAVSIAALDHDPHLHVVAGFELLPIGGTLNGIFERHAMTRDALDTSTWGKPAGDGTWTLGATNLIAATAVASTTIRPVQGHMEVLNVRAGFGDLVRAKYDGQNWSAPQTIASAPGFGELFNHAAFVEEVKLPVAVFDGKVEQDYCDYLVTWTDSDDIETGYNVYAEVQGSRDRKLVASTGPIDGGTTGVRVSSAQLEAGRSYVFRVAAIGYAGEGEPVYIGGATTTPIPSRPTIKETYSYTETNWSYLPNDHGPADASNVYLTRIVAWRRRDDLPPVTIDSGQLLYRPTSYIFGSPFMDSSNGTRPTNTEDTVDVGRYPWGFYVEVTGGFPGVTKKTCTMISEATFTDPVNNHAGTADPNAHPPVGSCCFDDPNDPGEE
jgi:streptogramin lyase